MSHGCNFYGSKSNFIVVRRQQMSQSLCSHRFYVSPFLSAVHILLIITNRIPGSSLFPDTNISYRNFPLFSSLPLGHAFIVPKIWSWQVASSLVFSSHFSSHVTVQHCAWIVSFIDIVLIFLTLRLLMSYIYIYGAPSKARNANVVYIWTYVWQRW